MIQWHPGVLFRRERSTAEFQADLLFQFPELTLEIVSLSCASNNNNRQAGLPLGKNTSTLPELEAPQLLSSQIQRLH